MQLDQALLALPWEYLTKDFDDEIVQAYYSYMVDIAVILGAHKERAMTELKESLLFEMKLANVRNTHLNSSYHVIWIQIDVSKCNVKSRADFIAKRGTSKRHSALQSDDSDWVNQEVFERAIERILQ